MPRLPLAAAAVLFFAAASDARTQAPIRNTVRVRVTTQVPEVAVLRELLPAEVRVLADGRREIAFRVTVRANCQWALSVRRRAWWEWRQLDVIEVQRADGTWATMTPATEAIEVIPQHEACNDDPHEVRLRVQDADALRVLDRVEFRVAPLPRG